MRTFAIAAIALFGLCATAGAQTAAQREACQADYQKFCSGVAPGGGRVLECLAKHMDQLSPACRQVVEENAK